MYDIQWVKIAVSCWAINSCVVVVAGRVVFTHNVHEWKKFRPTLSFPSLLSVRYQAQHNALCFTKNSVSLTLTNFKMPWRIINLKTISSSTSVISGTCTSRGVHPPTHTSCWTRKIGFSNPLKLMDFWIFWFCSRERETVRVMHKKHFMPSHGIISHYCPDELSKHLKTYYFNLVRR